jgi:DNA-binding beta-propeller fold protein YncE
LCVDSATGLIYSVDTGSGFIHELDPTTQLVYYTAGAGKLATFSDATSCVILDGGLYLTDTGNNDIKLINLGPSPTVINLVGIGSPGYSDSSSPAGAAFNKPQGMCTDGQTIYIVDSTNAAVRQLDPATNIVTTLVGGPDAGVFRNPYDCAWDPTSGNLFVSDQAVPPATPDGVGNVIYMVQ